MPREFDVVCLGAGVAGEALAAGLKDSGLSLATELFKEAEKRHGDYEPSSPKHHWSDWYSAYIVARQQGGTPEEAFQDGPAHIESTRR